jgi:hypothetical protein
MFLVNLKLRVIFLFGITCVELYCLAIRERERDGMLLMFCSVIINVWAVI